LLRCFFFLPENILAPGFFVKDTGKHEKIIGQAVQVLPADIA
jgi:hypothetical protein